MSFVWKPEKNDWLMENRGISFEEIVDALNEGKYMGSHTYTGKKGIHKNQIVIVLEIDGDLWRVPASLHSEFIFLRTAYPAEQKE